MAASTMMHSSTALLLRHNSAADGTVSSSVEKRPIGAAMRQWQRQGVAIREASSSSSILGQAVSFVQPASGTLRWNAGRSVVDATASFETQSKVSVVRIGTRGRSSTAVSVSSQKRDGVEQELATTLDLETEVGASLETLRDKLAAGEWEAADAETRRLLCVLAGEEAVKRKWVYFSEVKFIAVSDLTKVDSLWRQYSNGKFGYSVQKKIWNNSGKVWNAFFKKVGWTRPLDEYQDTYKKFPLEFIWDVAATTPEGHLPLTNALRGTRLLEEVLSHPAFDAVDEQSKLRAKPVTSLFGKSR